MSLKILGLIISTSANLVIGTYVLYKGPKKTVNRALSLLVYSFAIWSLFNLLVTISQDIKWVTFFGHCCFAAGNLVPIPLLYFVIVFPHPPPGLNKLKYGSHSLNYGIIITGIILIFLSFTNLIQREVYTLPDGTFRPLPGLLYPLFVAYIITGVGVGAVYLCQKWRTAKSGIEVIQLKIIFVGILSVTILAIITCAILPALGFAQFIAIGPVFSVMIAGFIAYSIVRYRLLDITVVVKKTALYTLLTGFVTALYIVGVLLAERLFRGLLEYEYQTFFPAVFAALIVAFVFLPLREKIQNLVDRLFGKKRYEYQRVLREMGKELNRVFAMPKLLQYILKNITKTMNISGGLIYLYEGNNFQVKAAYGEISYKDVKMSRNDPLLRWMLQRKDVVIREELERMKEVKKVQKMKNLLDELGMSIAIPIIRENILSGIIFLKNKSSGDIFNQEDINLLLTIANQAGVAVENARLYTQVEQDKIYRANILKNLASAVIVTDGEGKIRIFNEKAKQILGLSTSKVIGREYKKVLSAQFSKFIADSEEFGRGFSNNEMEYSKKGLKSPMILSVGTSVMKDKSNEVNGVTLVLSDLTEIRALEYQLGRAEELATVGTLAAGMAHEIKNPLVAINTFLELLPDKYDDPEFRGEFSEAAREEVKRINDLIHRLLHFAQPKPPNFTQCHIHDCIDESLKFMSTKLRNHNIEVIKKYDGNIPKSFIDKTRFDEVFLNLLLNAIDATKGGGELRITTSYKRSGGMGKILLKIQDTGEGISSENVSRIFDPFFSTKENGTGLGLSIVFRAINDHGGTIEVESKRNKGTTFLISLPVFSRKSEMKPLLT